MTPRSTASQAGLSLIGVLVATLVLVSGTLAVAQLVARTQHITGLALERFVAATIAREGLELVQAQRDTNWLAHDAATTGDCATARQPDGRDECWMENVCDADGNGTLSDHVIAIDRDLVGGITIIHNPTAQQQRLYTDATDFWSHVATGQATRYQRVITLNCAEQQAASPSVLVSSRVTWDSRGGQQQAEVKSRLYNWYKEL